MDAPNIDTRALFAPKKGKQATKGQKQIFEGNISTIKIYTYVAIASVFIRIFLLFIFGSSTPKVLITFFSTIVQALSIYGLHYMAKAVVSDSKTVIDGGIDLNLPGGFGDKIKDIIITTSGCSFLSYISEYFWLLWLWLPAYYIIQLWINVLGPWFFAPVPEVAPEIADKKRRKLERKMARTGYR